MPKLLLSNNQKGWAFFQRLLVDLFKFMEPYLRNAELSDPVRLLYKGTLRVLLVLLHDFLEFLCDYHFSYCDVIPPSCILSAFPRNMRLPDPFTPNLKVDLLPEISQSPRILFEVDAALKSRQMKTEVDEYFKVQFRYMRLLNSEASSACSSLNQEINIVQRINILNSSTPKGCEFTNAVNYFSKHGSLPRKICKDLTCSKGLQTILFLVSTDTVADAIDIVSGTPRKICPALVALVATSLFMVAPVAAEDACS
ncbi:uncharacterized protein LOC131067223 [Cryptomeria japonica]|uniref:uncharacterized protein LOC131067223 n=1 Tax=Cryptomeria japonica TaxID=3369 RepID=UPI0027DAAB08|nr:uncharacterized protein LOC131067223 [Cryptomeria japonica]